MVLSDVLPALLLHTKEKTQAGQSRRPGSEQELSISPHLEREVVESEPELWEEGGESSAETHTA